MHAKVENPWPIIQGPQAVTWVTWPCADIDFYFLKYGMFTLVKHNYEINCIGPWWPVKEISKSWKTIYTALLHPTITILVGQMCCWRLASNQPQTRSQEWIAVACPILMRWCLSRTSWSGSMTPCPKATTFTAYPGHGHSWNLFWRRRVAMVDSGSEATTCWGATLTPTSSLFSRATVKMIGWGQREPGNSGTRSSFSDDLKTLAASQFTTRMPKIQMNPLG